LYEYFNLLEGPGSLRPRRDAKEFLQPGNYAGYQCRLPVAEP